MSSASNAAIEEELRSLDLKLGQLRRDYDQYFLGARPREPVQLRGEVNKAIARLSNTAIQNTRLRFKFSSLCSRYQAFKRQWDETQRKIEAGTYDRHRFRADRRLSGPPAGRAASQATGGEDLYQAYLDARLACGQPTKGLTREKIEQQLVEQRQQLARRFGEEAQFQFRVAVEDGKVRLKARRIRDAEA